MIQKLAQTRDAIAAHKAIVCSPSGFTQEAIKVAKAHGIALWVIAARQRVSGPSHWHSSSARAATPTFHDRVEDRLRERLAQAWGVSLGTTGAPGMWRVKDIRAAWNDGTKKTIQNKAGKFITPFSTVSVFDEWLSDFLFDSIFRVAQKAEETRADIQRIRSECEEAERRKRDQDVQRFQRYFLQNRRADLEE